jgi:ATP-binding cassette subfamily B protein
MPEPSPEPSPGPSRLGRLFARRVPVVRQLHATDCGAACIAMALSYFGSEVPLDRIRDVMGVGRDGSSALALLRTARHYGLGATGYKVETLDDLSLLRAPAILHWEFAHFVVFEGVSKRGVDIVDPAVGRRCVPFERFNRSFTGVAIGLEEGADLQKLSSSGPKLRRYSAVLFAKKAEFARILLISLMVQLFGLSLPLLTGMVVDRVVPRQDYHLLTLIGAGLGAVVLFGFFSSLVRSHLLLHLRTQLDAKLTLGFLSHLVRLPYSFFQTRTASDLMSRLSSNQQIREILSATTISTGLDGTMVLLYLLVLLASNPTMGLLALGIGLCQVIVTVIARARQRELARRAIEAAVRSQGTLFQLLAGIETLKSSGIEHRAIDRWTGLYIDELNVNLERGRLSAWTDSLLSAMKMASPLVILMVGAWQAARGIYPLGQMLAWNALAVNVLTPFSALVSSVTQFQLLGTYLARINDVMETAPEQDPQQPTRPARLIGNIEVDRVSFRHSPMSKLVLRDVSLSIRAGQMVAIVGRSGSGKSTLARLLVGLYRPTSGQILYDGVELLSQDLRSLRAQMGIVMQSSYLFGGTIREVLSVADPSVPLERVIEAARLARIHDDIASMPMAYETGVVDGGLSFSGGQRQRLAIARALLTRPRVLLLDEATSALDSQTESAVQASIEALGITRIVIAHRLSTVVRADQILVLEDGVLVERGTHEELLRAGGAYAQMVAAQRKKGRPQPAAAGPDATPEMRPGTEPEPEKEPAP